MNVILLARNQPNSVCGVGIYTKKLQTALARQQINTTVLTNFTYKQIFSLSDKQTIVHLQFPTVQGYSIFQLFILPLLLRLKGVETIVTLHEHEPYYSAAARYRDCLVALVWKKVITNNQQAQTLLRKRGLQSTIVYNAPTLLCPRFPSPAKEVDIVFFGHIGESKGVLELVKTVSELGKTLIIIGSYSPDDSYHEKVYSYVGENITWLSGLSDSQSCQHIATARLAVLPFTNGVSEKNSTLLNMMQLEVPVLTTGPVPSILKDAVLIIDDKNLGVAITSALANPQDLSDVARQAKRLVDTTFTWHHNAQMHLSLYRQLLDRAKATKST